VKILFVIPEYPPDFGGGIVTYYRHLIPALRETGCDITVLKGSAFVHGNESYEHDGVRVSLLETARYFKWRDHFNHFAMFPELRCHLAASFALHEQAGAGEGFDAVEVTDWGMLFLPWVIAAKTRVLVQLHGSVGQISCHEPVTGREAEAALSMLLEQSGLREGNTHCSTYSQNNALWWEKSLKRAVFYVPPPLPVQAVNGRSVTGDTWLTVGRIQHWKGPQVACAAWTILGQAAPQLEWVGRDTIHGLTGETTSAWLQTHFSQIWGRRIAPVGQMSPDDVKNRMRAAKALLVPSTWDVFNLGAVEAMALGTVVVASTGAGAVDLIEHGVNGFTFSNGDADVLAQLVRTIEQMDDGALRAIGGAAAATVRETLNPMGIAEQKRSLYQELPASCQAQSSWLEDCLSPSPDRAPLKFLDHLPLKDLSRYVVQRSARKAFWWQNLK
jgi:glycosyltransferase involved in cell wall biosynthesis